jgi:hypothetical protein
LRLWEEPCGGWKRWGVKSVVKRERKGRMMVRIVRAGERGKERVARVMCS